MSSQREGGKGGEGRYSTKDLVCIYVWPMDTDNGPVRAWGRQEGTSGGKRDI